MARANSRGRRGVGNSHAAIILPLPPFRRFQCARRGSLGSSVSEINRDFSDKSSSTISTRGASFDVPSHSCQTIAESDFCLFFFSRFSYAFPRAILIASIPASPESIFRVHAHLSRIRSRRCRLFFSICAKRRPAYGASCPSRIRLFGEEESDFASYRTRNPVA